ncbi:hypothetical protein ALC60_10729 [Trachymyrmex zeteki]|uniref:Uncharacterized protein n=1 Tax=Mycetomoellerius zeteki TaxID=64791 RepID=A0A151WQP7_9HYME|nr:hypothetical protein ALC60_10729 [Trachymyrmex zeteki]
MESDIWRGRDEEEKEEDVKNDKERKRNREREREGLYGREGGKISLMPRRFARGTDECPATDDRQI